MVLMVKASGPGRRNPMIKIRELVSTVGSLRYEEVDGVRKEKERLTTDHQSYLPFSNRFFLRQVSNAG